MNNKLSINLLTIAPLALWGYMSISLNRMMNVLPPEHVLDAYITSVLMYVILALYYIVLRMHLKNSVDNAKQQKYCIACLAIGLVFLVCAFVL